MCYIPSTFDIESNIEHDNARVQAAFAATLDVHHVEVQRIRDDRVTFSDGRGSLTVLLRCVAQLPPIFGEVLEGYLLDLADGYTVVIEEE